MSLREVAADLFPDRVRGIGAIRRMTVGFVDKVLWQLVGVRLLDGSAETGTAEPFTGIGFYSRPPANGSPEAVVVMAGGAKSPAIVGLRDEKTRAKVAGGLVADEAMVFNSTAVVYVKADGSVEVRSATGIAVKLPTLADLQAVVDYVNKQFSSTGGHVHAVAGGSTGGNHRGCRRRHAGNRAGAGRHHHLQGPVDEHTRRRSEGDDAMTVARTRLAGALFDIGGALATFHAAKRELEAAIIERRDFDADIAIDMTTINALEGIADLLLRLAPYGVVELAGPGSDPLPTDKETR